MKSLRDLNNYSNTLVEFVDNRPFSIVMSASTGDKTITANEGEGKASPAAVEITSLISAPNTISYTVDLTSAGGNAVLQWANLPAHIIASKPSAYSYRVTGIRNISDWNLVRHPIIYLGTDYATNFTYTAAIDAGSPNVATWSVSVIINDLSEVNTVSPPAISYDEDITKVFGVGNLFQVTDTEHPFDGSLYTVTGTLSAPAAGVLHSNAAIATQTFSNGVLSITDVKSKVNAYLNSMTFIPTTDYDQSFSIQWVLRNEISGLVTTLSPQNVSIGQTNNEISNIGITRSYQTNGVDLLFPSSIPIIDEIVPNASYEIRMTLTTAFGIIEIGDDLINMPRWNSTLRRFTYTGTRDQCNTMFSQVRFFGLKGTSPSGVCDVTILRDGVQTVVSAFQITGTARAVAVAATPVVLAEDSITYNWGAPGFYPHYSEPFALVIKAYNGSHGTAQNTFAWFNQTGWTIEGTVANQYGVYKNVTPKTTVNDFLLERNSVTGIQLALRPDVSGAYSLRLSVCANGSYNGASFVGGLTTTIWNDYAITDTSEYLLSDSTYDEDRALSVPFQITDVDANYSSYTVTFTQMSPSPVTSPCSFYIDNVAQTAGQPIVLTGTKEYINARSVKFLPPADHTDTIQLKYRQTKLDSSLSIVQANDILKSYACSVQNTEFETPGVVIYPTIYVDYPMSGFYITDTDPTADGIPNATRQYSVTVVDNAGKGKFFLNGNAIAGHSFTFTGFKDSVNSQLAGTIWRSQIDHDTTFNFSCIRTTSNNLMLREGLITVHSTAPAYGALWNGGYFAGRVSSTGTTDDYYIVLSPYLPYYTEPDHFPMSATSDFDHLWLNPKPGTWSGSWYGIDKPADNSFYDGYANTVALASYGKISAGDPGYSNYGVMGNVPCGAVRLETTNGYNDWYLPSANELTLCKTRTGQPYQSTTGYKGIYWSSTLKTEASVLKIYYSAPQVNTTKPTPYVTTTDGSNVVFSGTHAVGIEPIYSDGYKYYRAIRRVPITSFA